MSARFPVKVDGQWREAEIRFATEREVKRLVYWRLPRTLPNDALVVRKTFDAVEFARLASNRWRYYHRDGATAKSFEHLVDVIRQRPRAEVAMVLIARPTWTSKTPTLGIAYLRRTWCHHLFLEFFATHPQVIAKKHEQIGGVGVGILGQLVSLAETLKIRSHGVLCIMVRRTTRCRKGFRSLFHRRREERVARAGFCLWFSLALGSQNLCHPFALPLRAEISLPVNAHTHVSGLHISPAE